MSSYYIKAKRKSTGKIETIHAIDDFYGKHRYGYQDKDGTTVDEEGFDLLFEKVETPMNKEQQMREEKESWEEKFDELYVNTEGCQAGHETTEDCYFCNLWGGADGVPKYNKPPTGTAGDIKLFIRNLLQSDRQVVREWIKENEYCSKCCSPRKFCPEWGRYPSAIDTEDLLKFLSDN